MKVPVAPPALRMFVRAFCRNDRRQLCALESLFLTDPPLSVRAAAELSGLPRSTVHDLVAEFRTTVAVACEAEGVDPASLAAA